MGASPFGDPAALTSFHLGSAGTELNTVSVWQTRGRRVWYMSLVGGNGSSWRRGVNIFEDPEFDGCRRVSGTGWMTSPDVTMGVCRFQK